MVNTRLKLLVVIPDIAAGTGTFCKNLGAGLRRHFADEIEAALLLLRTRPLCDEERAAYEHVYTLGAGVDADWRRWYQVPLDAWRLRRAVRRIAPDVVFTIGTYSNLLAPLAAGAQRTVLSEHMNMTLRTAAARHGSIMRTLMRWRYPKCRIVAASRGITQDLEQHFGARWTRVIPNGLDAGRVRRLAEEPPPPLPPGPFNIAIGRLTQQKDYPTLLRAQAIARQRGLAEHLVIAGDGELRGELEQLARSLGIADSTHFLGHQPNPYPILKRARCLILSSVFEGFAYVPIEAMALGRPVIATDCPSGPADILGDGQYGVLTPVNNPEKLADAMLRLCGSPAEYAHFAAAALRRADELSIERMARDYRDLFLEIAASTR